MLPLDDIRWKDLDHRGWTKGQRYSLDPEAPYVPEELKKILEMPAKIELFGALWPYLCSEGTAWAAAYAVVPYAVEIAKRLPPEQRLEHLYFIGLVVMCSCPREAESFAIKEYLVADYQQALIEALPLLAETLCCRHDQMSTCYLLAATAALKGHRQLAGVLDGLDGACPHCGGDLLEQV
jgi:hypothetical protein